MVSLFVGNLSRNVSTQTLKNLFETVAVVFVFIRM
jgi:hypothetical protein